MVIQIGGKEIVIERLFRGSVINYKNLYLQTRSQVLLRFAAESVVKTLSLESLQQVRNNNKALNRAIQKFQIKISRLPVAPLDYILVLPRKVYGTLIDRTREKMLFGKQELLMESLQEKKDYYKKYQGLEMDDVQIAKTLRELQQDMLSDQEVIHYMTKLNHLELRVKNVAIMKLLKLQAQAKQSNMKETLAQLITLTTEKSNSRMKLLRMNTVALQADGLVARLGDKISETQRRIVLQTNTIKKIQANIELLLPVRDTASGAGYEVPED